MTITDAPAVRQARGGRDPNLVRLLVMLVFVFVLMTILRPGQFATLADFNSMMRQFPEYGIMAVGMSLTMITGGIDLGVVGTANLSAIVAATFLIGTVRWERRRSRSSPTSSWRFCSLSPPDLPAARSPAR